MDEDVSLYVCDICGQEGLTDESMRSHVLLEHVESQISCPFCDLEGTTLEEMSIHINSQHNHDMLTSLSPQKPQHDHNMLTPLGPQNQQHEEDMLTSISPQNQRETAEQHDKDIEKVKVFEGLQEMMGMGTSNRARMTLDMQRSKNKPLELGPILTCPMCSWSSRKPDEITQHVNAAHLDATTPSKGSFAQVFGNQEQMECPLCSFSAGDSTSLEQHVYSSHGDELGASASGAASNVPETNITDATSSPLSCPMCTTQFSNPKELEKHVEDHFSSNLTMATENRLIPDDHILAQRLQAEQEEAAKKQEQREFEQLQKQFGMSGNNNYKKQSEKSLEQAVVKGQLSITDFYVKRHEMLEASNSGIDDGRSCTKGIIEALHKFYANNPKNVERYWLCSPVDHFSSTFSDKGWGCGYRNLQMVLSSLAKKDIFKEPLFNDNTSIPSIPKIQRLIEAAWENGFDRAGCEQLGGKVVNTSKWIGATEIVATLSSLRVKCRLVDFHSPTGDGSTHPRLFEWVRNFYSRDNIKAPLYFQHQGHSRTIIGVEQLKDSSLRLLLFDPSSRHTQMSQFVAGDISATLMRTVRRPVTALRAKQYQLVAVTGLMNDAQLQESKLLKSEQVP